MTDPSGGTPGELNSVYLPDIEGPVPVDVAVSLDGLTLTVPLMNRWTKPPSPPERFQ